jgi:hypothetical protein
MDGCGGHSSMLVRRHGTSPLPRTAFAVFLALLAAVSSLTIRASVRNGTWVPFAKIVELFTQRSEGPLVANG